MRRVDEVGLSDVISVIADSSYDGLHLSQQIPKLAAAFAQGSATR